MLILFTKFLAYGRAGGEQISFHDLSNLDIFLAPSLAGEGY